MTKIRTNALAKTRISPNESGVISQQTVDRLKKKQVRWFYRDTKLLGFFVQNNPSGTKKYGYETRWLGRGKQKRKMIGSTEMYSAKEARDIATDGIRLIKQGIDPDAEKEKALRVNSTLSDMLEDYMSRKNLATKTEADYWNLMKNPLAPFSDRLITNITHQEISDWYASFRGDKEVSANRALSVLKNCFKSAVFRDIIQPNDNPMLRLKDNLDKYKEYPKETILKDELLPRFLESFVDLGQRWDWDKKKKKRVPRKDNKCINETIRDWILLKLITGCRSTELKVMKWKDVDYKKALITFRETKFSVPLTLPLTRLMILILHNLHQSRSSDYIFPPQSSQSQSEHLNDPKRVFAKVSKHSNMPRTITPHDLRHTFMNVAEFHATYYRDGNSEVRHHIPQHDIKVLVNHKVDLHRGYAGTNLNHMRKQLEAVSSYLNSSIPVQDFGTGKTTHFSGIFEYVFYGDDENFIPYGDAQEIKTLDKDSIKLLKEMQDN